jgi:hypothetical protein
MVKCCTEDAGPNSSVTSLLHEMTATRAEKETAEDREAITRYNEQTGVATVSVRHKLKQTAG